MSSQDSNFYTKFRNEIAAGGATDEKQNKNNKLTTAITSIVVVGLLVWLSKGITGGYLPLAATLTTDKVYDAFLGDPASGRTFFHGHTYTGNPLGCAAALASLKLFETNRVLDNVAECSRHLTRRLAELRDWPHVGEIRQKGILVGIELVSDKATQQAFAPDQRIGHQVTLAARRRGLFTRPLGDVVTIVPAPAMPAELVNRVCDLLFDSIREVVLENK